jgi:hypothetical protein
MGVDYYNCYNCNAIYADCGTCYECSWCVSGFCGNCENELVKIPSNWESVDVHEFIDEGEILTDDFIKKFSGCKYSFYICNGCFEDRCTRKITDYEDKFIRFLISKTEFTDIRQAIKQYISETRITKTHEHSKGAAHKG